LFALSGHPDGRISAELHLQEAVVERPLADAYEEERQGR
jgi:hypothetical protein